MSTDANETHGRFGMTGHGHETSVGQGSNGVAYRGETEGVMTTT